MTPRPVLSCVCSVWRPTDCQLAFIYWLTWPTARFRSARLPRRWNQPNPPFRHLLRCHSSGRVSLSSWGVIKTKVMTSPLGFMGILQNYCYLFYWCPLPYAIAKKYFAAYITASHRNGLQLFQVLLAREWRGCGGNVEMHSSNNNCGIKFLPCQRNLCPWQR